jgi:hypothetical protein
MDKDEDEDEGVVQEVPRRIRERACVPGIIHIRYIPFFHIYIYIYIYIFIDIYSNIDEDENEESVTREIPRRVPAPGHYTEFRAFVGMPAYPGSAPDFRTKCQPATVMNYVRKKPYLTQCFNQSVLESQLPHKTVN